MQYRFNTPPGWPPAPAGWAPPPEWRPDPTWPAAPPDWQWWIPLEAPAPTPDANLHVQPSNESTAPAEPIAPVPDEGPLLHSNDPAGIEPSASPERAPAAAGKGVGAQCLANDGLLETNLGELRDELGYKKLGKWVLEEIKNVLTFEGLGFFPQWTLNPDVNTEPRQWQNIWIYAKDGSPRARVIDAVLEPEDINVRAILDGIIAGSPGALTAEQKLEQIRTIVAAPSPDES